MILWNPETDICYLEAYWKLEVITEDPNRTNWNPARFEANLLRQASLGFFNVRTGRQVRCMTHEVWARHVGDISEHTLWMAIYFELQSIIIVIFAIV